MTDEFDPTLEASKPASETIPTSATPSTGLNPTGDSSPASSISFGSSLPSGDAPAGSASPSTEEHRAQAPESVRCFIVTVSDTRTLETDKGGALIVELLTNAGHKVIGRTIVGDNSSAIESTVRATVYHRDEPEAIIVTGGSGIGPRDVTPEALKPLLTKELPGFGEIFRMLSWEEVGPASMLSRAFAGVLGRTLLFVLPGSTNAVSLAMEKLILPELGHLIREVRPERRRER